MITDMYEMIHAIDNPIHRREFIHEQGLVTLGRGYNSIAYSRADLPYVIKFAQRMDGSYRWCHLAMEKAYQSNPYIPRTYAIVEHSFQWIVFQEKLTAGNDPDFSSRVHHIDQLVFDYVEKNKHPGKINRQLLLAIEGIKSIFDLNSDNVDIGIPNCMLRGNQIVITDPIC